MLIIKKYRLINFLFLFLITTSCFAQYYTNANTAKTLFYDRNEILTSIYGASSLKTNYKLSYNQSFYLNTNLPNLENQNGNYFPKGYGIFYSLLFQYQSRHFTLTAEPIMFVRKQYDISIPHKENEFSVLNDVPLNDIYEQ